MKKAVIILSVLAVIYLFICLFLVLFQKRFIFLPSRGSQPPPDSCGIGDVYIPTPDGETLHGWKMETDPNAPWILFFHGNAGNVSTGGERMLFFRKRGLNVLTADYRGYGLSTGKIMKEQDLYTDAASCWVYLHEKCGIPAEKIIVWGWSLGGAAASFVAAEYSPLALVMESTFYSMLDIARMRFPFVPIKWLFRFPFQSGTRLPRVNCPVLVIHSPEDQTIPYDHSTRLLNSVKTKKLRITIRGNHGHGIYESEDLLEPGLQNFLKGLTENERD